VTSEEPKLSVKVRVPGSQNFTPQQRIAIGELVSDLEESGYDATFPRRITASVTVAALGAIGLYITDKVLDKTLDVSVDKLLGIGIDWAKRQFKKPPTPLEEQPRRTTVRVLYGPNEEVIAEVEVHEDDEDS
jgi:hypothetical protein